MLSWMMMKMMDPMMDNALVKMMTEDYPDNPFLMTTVAEKMTPRAIIEATMRAESGKELTRPLGSPVVLSAWKQILLNPRQLFQMPRSDYTSVDTQAIIGRRAKHPLKLDIPIMITGMSYGGSLSLPMKVAIAKGASMAGTSTNTGESGLAKEERDAANLLVGQYNRGGWMNIPEYLSQLDAIEIQLGQGAWGGAVDEPMKADTIGEHLREVLRISKGADTGIHARMPGINTPKDIINLVNNLKAQYDVPIGIKIAGTDFIEYELAVIAQTQADYIVVDGAEGGTSHAHPTLEDDLGLPTLPTLVRTIDWLESQGIRDHFDVICTGGLATPGHFLKAMAIGANAVYIGTIAMMATLQVQMAKVLPQAPPPQLALYDGKMTDKLDIDMAAQSLANFLKSCAIEMQLAAQAVGRQALNELNRDDLVCVDKDLAEFMGIRYANSHRQDQQQDTPNRAATSRQTAKASEQDAVQYQ